MRDLVLAGHVRDAVSRWVEQRTGDEMLGANIRFLTPASLLVEFARRAERRKRKPEDPREKDVRKLLRGLKGREKVSRQTSTGGHGGK